MEYENLKKLLDQSRNIVFFGGAGVSTESNIPDFRSEDGIYKAQNTYGHSPEEMLSYSFFQKHMKEFYAFYKKEMIFKDARPNAAHLALARLEEEGRLKAVITQNIDGLHQMAGSKEVVELHGSVHRNYCMNCGQKYSLDYILEYEDIPLCGKCGGLVRPDVVLYEEGLDSEIIEKAISYISAADTFIIGGTSLAVYPAAGMIDYYRGDRLVLINKSKTPYDKRANLLIYDSIGRVLGSI